MIKRVRIQEFKSIRDITLELDPVTVLVGRSGTGKSNIVQALRFLRNLILDYDTAIATEGGWARIIPGGLSLPKTSIEIQFSVPGEDREYSYHVAFQMVGSQKLSISQGIVPQLVRESLSLGNETLYSCLVDSSNIWKWEKKPNVTVIPSFTHRPMIGNFPALQQVVYAYAAISNGIGYYHFPFTALSEQKANKPHKNLPGLWDNAGNYMDVMKGIIQDFQHPDVRKNILASVQRVNPSIRSIELDSLVDPKKAIVGHEAGETILDLTIDQESDGLRRFYSTLLALYQTPSKLTMIFEEPENAIFPGALSLLADEFKSAPKENRGQVVLTTHSPSLLDAFDVGAIRVVDLDAGYTTVGPVSAEQQSAVKNNLLTTGELLTVEEPRNDHASRTEQHA